MVLSSTASLIHYLGHAPDIAHKHYINSNGEGFDNSVR